VIFRSSSSDWRSPRACSPVRRSVPRPVAEKRRRVVDSNHKGCVCALFGRRGLEEERGLEPHAPSRGALCFRGRPSSQPVFLPSSTWGSAPNPAPLRADKNPRAADFVGHAALGLRPIPRLRLPTCVGHPRASARLIALIALGLWPWLALGLVGCGVPRAADFVGHAVARKREVSSPTPEEVRSAFKAAPAPCRFLFRCVVVVWCLGLESNQLRPTFQAGALPN
jgi:hypothetical protein